LETAIIANYRQLSVLPAKESFAFSTRHNAANITEYQTNVLILAIANQIAISANRWLAKQRPVRRTKRERPGGNKGLKLLPVDSTP